jgi:peptidoglycan/LPS O-acetylase OafA/YrhL
MTASANRAYLPEVDQIRALAALLVLFYHGLQVIGAQLAYGRAFDPVTDWLYPSNPLITIIEEGHSGVALFIVLSGFILARGAIGNEVRYGPFLIARAWRIYPMMLLCLVVAVSAREGASLAEVAGIILPILPVGGLSTHLTAMLWAVTVELQCYLLFPFLIRFSNARGVTFLLQVVAVAFLMRILVMLGDGADIHRLGYWTVVGRIDQFALGIVAARLYPAGALSRWRGLIWLGLSLAVASASLGFYNRHHLFRPLWFDIVWPTFEGALWAVFLVAYLAVARTILPKIVQSGLTRFGVVSYSFYLLHFAVIYAAIHVGAFVRLTGSPYPDAIVTTLIVVLPVTLALSVLTYNTVEAPFLALRPQYIRRPLSLTANQDAGPPFATATRAGLNSRPPIV